MTGTKNKRIDQSLLFVFIMKTVNSKEFRNGEPFNIAVHLQALINMQLKNPRMLNRQLIAIENKVVNIDSPYARAVQINVREGYLKMFRSHCRSIGTIKSFILSNDVIDEMIDEMKSSSHGVGIKNLVVDTLMKKKKGKGHQSKKTLHFTVQ